VVEPDFVFRGSAAADLVEFICMSEESELEVLSNKEAGFDHIFSNTQKYGVIIMRNRLVAVKCEISWTIIYFLSKILNARPANRTRVPVTEPSQAFSLLRVTDLA